MEPLSLVSVTACKFAAFFCLPEPAAASTRRAINRNNADSKNTHTQVMIPSSSTPALGWFPEGVKVLQSGDFLGIKVIVIIY